MICNRRTSFLLAAIAAFCVVLPGHARADETSSEIKMGTAAAADVDKSVRFVTNKADVDRVEAVGARIAAIADTVQVPAGFGNDHVSNFHYTYKLIDDPEVNAFSIPGGHIYIYKGMFDLLKTDDELAGVLGHETAHAAHHHVSTIEHDANKMSNEMLIAMLAGLIGHMPTDDLAGFYSVGSYATEGILNNKYSEAAEEDADHTGMIFMKKAGYDPVGMLSMLQRLQDLEDRSPNEELGFLRDHPLTSDRVAAATNELASLGVAVTPGSLRQVSGSLQVDVTPVTTAPGSKFLDLTIGGTSVCFLAPANQVEAQEAADRLNKLLNQNLQLYEVKAVDNNVVIRGQTLLSITGADASLQQPPVTPDAVAISAAKSVQRALWQETVRGVNSN